MIGHVDPFGKTVFTGRDIFDKFIPKRNAPFSFATITDKADDVFAIPEKNFFFRFETYDETAYRRILDQASEWQLKFIRTEEWDPSMYPNRPKTVTESLHEISPKLILVKNNAFAGVIRYLDAPSTYDIVYGLIENYADEPLLCWSYSGSGSSDWDMIYYENHYLIKKSLEHRCPSETPEGRF